MTDICPECGNEYDIVASHWSRGSCDHPSFTDHQKEIITGLLMGDGNLKINRDNPSLRCKMTSPNYLKYLDKQFGVFGKGVSLRTTAEEKAKLNRESGFSPNARAENYSNLYIWRSMSHPELREFEKWYDTGSKVWPDDIELTPTVLKHWYCGDGSYNNKSNKYISISCANERGNKEKIEKMFNNVGFSVAYWHESTRYNNGYEGTVSANIAFDVTTTKELFEYMGDPLPDFEYKWPDERLK